MTDFHRLVGGEDVVADVGMEFRSNQRPGGGDEAVDHHRQTQGRTAQHQAGNAADLEAADLGQHVDGILGIGKIDFQSGFDHLNFVGQGGVADAGATVGHLGHRQAAEGGDDGRRGGGVADPHIPGADQIDPLLDTALRQLDADFQAADRLLAGHRRPLGEVAGTVADLFRQQPIQRRKIVIHPHVDHPHLGPGVTGQGVDGGAAVDEVEHHLRRHFLGKSAYPLGGHPMIAGKGEDHLPADILPAGDGDIATGELLQAAEGTLGLGLAVEVGLHRAQAVGVNRLNPGKGGGKVEARHGRQLLCWEKIAHRNRTGNPETTSQAWSLTAASR